LIVLCYLFCLKKFLFFLKFLISVSNLDKLILNDSIHNNNHFDLVEEEVVADNQYDKMCDVSCFVALHIGAGFHSKNKTGVYRELCENICQNVMKLLKKGMIAREAVASAVVFLEVKVNLFCLQLSIKYLMS
jgi:hypothetical protein